MTIVSVLKHAVSTGRLLAQVFTLVFAIAACGTGAGAGPDAAPGSAADAASSDSDAAGSDLCETGELRCAGSCAVCPAEVGPLTCQNEACVFDTTACATDERPCADGCCAWLTEQVAVADSANLALQSDGQPIIVFERDEALHLATRAGGIWASEEILVAGSQALGIYPSIAIADDGTLFVAAARKGSPSAIYLYTRAPAATTWQETVVDDDAQAAIPLWASIVLDLSDAPWIVFEESSPAEIRVYHREGTTWISESLGSSVPKNVPPRLRFESDGTPAVAFVRPVTAASAPVVRARRVGTTWSFDDVDARDSLLGSDAAFALRADGSGSVLYGSNDAAGELRLAQEDGASWTSSVVLSDVDDAWSARLELDDRDRPHGVCLPLDSTFGTGLAVEYVVRLGGVWWSSRVAGGDLGTELSFDLDAENNPHVLYLQDDAQDVRYLHYAH